MAREGFTRQVSEFVAALRYEDLPPSVVAKAKECILDQMGVQIMGSTLEWNKLVGDFVRDYAGKPESTVVNYGYRVPAYDAALSNATFGQGCELDDYGNGGHGGAATVPVGLALSETQPMTGRSLINAVVAGYEVMYRVGQLAAEGMRRRGFHSDSVLGFFGAAATAAKALALTPVQTLHSLAIVGSHACGTLEFDQSGGEVKRLHAGLGARGGIQSALLAERGLTGPSMILEGRRGICRTFADYEGDFDPALRGLGQDFLMPMVSFKIYPCLGRIASSIDAVVQLTKEHAILPQDIASIDIEVNENTLLHGGFIRQPKDVCGAQVSLAFCVALRLARGSNDLALYLDPQVWVDPVVLALIEKIQVRADPEARGERLRSARVAVRLASGRRVEAHQVYPKGSPNDPLSWSELADKFTRLASTALAPDQICQVLGMVERLESLQDVSSLMPLLVSKRTQPRHRSSSAEVGAK